MTEPAAMLHFGVDTAGLKEAADLAPKVEKGLMGVADGADKVAESSKKAGDAAAGMAESVSKVDKAVGSTGRVHEDAARKIEATADAAKKVTKETTAAGAASDELKKKLQEQAVASAAAAEALWKEKVAKAAAAEEARKHTTALKETVAEQDKLNKVVAAAKAPANAPGVSASGIPITANPWNGMAARKDLNGNTGLRNLFYSGAIRATGGTGDDVDAFTDAIRRRQTPSIMGGVRRVGGQALSGIREGIGEAMPAALAGGVAGVAAAGAAMAVEKAVEKVHELWQELKNAGEEADAMERRWDGFERGAAYLDKMRDAASGAGASFKDFARDVEVLEEKFNRFYSNTDQNQRIVETLRAAASNAGVKQADAGGFVDSQTSLFDKQRITSADIGDMNAQAPGTAGIIARRLGVGDENGLKLMAANGRLSGEAFAKAWLAARDEIMARKAKNGETIEESDNKAANSADRLNEAISKATWLRDFITSTNSTTAAINNWFADKISGKPAEAAPAGKPRAPTKEERQQAALAEQRAATDARLSSYDQLYSRYGGVFAQRGDAQKDMAEVQSTIRDLSARKDLTKDQEISLDRLRQMLPEIKRQAEGTVTPFQRVTKETDALAEAMERGGGGAADLFQQAASMAEQQRRLVGAASKDANDFLAILVQQRRLQAENEIGANAARVKQQSILAGSILKAGGNGDDLRMQADAEAATWKFQKFGDTIKDNDAIVRRYADGLYQLKLAMRDVSDASDAKAMNQQTEGMRAANEAMRNGASVEEGERVRRSRMDKFFADDRTGARGVAATGPITITGMGQGDEPIVASAGSSQHWIAEGLRKRGIAGHIADGSWAGAMAESRGDIRAFNKAGGGQGAFGIGQWRGPRLRELRRKYGMNPTDDQQLDHLAWELKGGDRGGGSVMRARTADEALYAYVHDFMRPGDAGAAGDMRRGRRYLRGVGAGGAGVASNDNAAPETYTLPGMPGRAAGASAENWTAIQARSASNVESDANAILREYTKLRASNDQARRSIATLESGDPRAARDAALSDKIGGIERTYKAGKDRDNLIQLTKEADELQRQKELAEEIGRQRADQGALERERELLRYGGDELKVQTEVLRERNRLIEMGVDLESAPAKQVLAETEGNARRNVKNKRDADRIKTMRDGLDEAAQGFGNSIEGAFDRAFTHGTKIGKAFMDGLANTAHQALNRLLEAVVINPIVGALGNALQTGFSALMGGVMPQPGGAGGFGGGGGQTFGTGAAPGGLEMSYGVTGAANGAVFGSQGVVPFALGGTGTFNTPTRLAMANGGTAMIGEAGETEAVMPLRRGPDGKLGVRTSGGSGGGDSGLSVVINDNRSGTGSEAVKVEERRAGNGQRQLHVMVRDSVRAATAGGEFDSDFGAQYGIGRPVARR